MYARILADQILSSFTVNPPARETLHRARHSFDLGTFSLLDDMVRRSQCRGDLMYAYFNT
jgi:hypothetical protein